MASGVWIGFVLLPGLAGRPAHPARAAAALTLAGLLVQPSVPAKAGGGGGSIFERNWLIADSLGSAQAMVAEDGWLVRETSFRPFGKVDQDVYAANPPKHATFAGHRLEPATDLYYMQARWMNPVTGTFLSIDPIVADLSDPQTLNAYSYALNNPVAFTDPTGGHAEESGDLPYHHPGCFFKGVDNGMAVFQVVGELGAGTDEGGGSSGNSGGGGTGESAASVSGGEAVGSTAAGSTADIASVSQSEPGLDQPIVFDPTEMLAGAIAGGIVLGLPGVIGGGLLGGLAKSGLRAAARGAPEIGQKVFRVWGDEAGAWGKSWTRIDPRTTSDYRNAAGLPRQNTGRFVNEGRLKSTQGVEAQRALSLEGKSGGLDELVVPDPRQQIELEGVFGVNPEY